MKILGVIPARYASTRFPGKPLALIAGKPMLEWVVEAARSCDKIDEVIVATDDQRILQLGERIGVEVVMTSPDLPSGSDRVNAAIEGLACDVVLNIQGDEPLLDAATLESLCLPFEKDESLQMATLAHACHKEDLGNIDAAKVITNQQGDAIYFSRFGIPYSRHEASSNGDELESVLRHIGLYAYRPEFLKAYCEQGVCGIEEAEGLEQLRALYMGAKLRVVKVNSKSCGVDRPDDIEKVEKILRERGA